LPECLNAGDLVFRAIKQIGSAAENVAVEKGLGRGIVE